jgi:enoyl-CoA hydratase
MDQLESFILERVGKVGLVKINRPAQLNTFNMKMFEELELISKRIEQDHEILCVVLTGEGKNFSAGIDIALLKETSSQWSLSNVPNIQHYLFRWANLSQPIIAAINGACIGAGLEFALACDIRIAAANAKFATPEVSFGLSPDMGGSQRLPRLIGPSQAKRLLLACENFDAQEALRIGVVDEVVEAENLLKRALNLAGKIARHPPMAVRFAKKAVNLAMESSTYAGMLFEQVQSIYSLGSEDKDEAANAFLEKRPAQFKGR